MFCKRGLLLKKWQAFFITQMREYSKPQWGRPPGLCPDLTSPAVIAPVSAYYALTLLFLQRHSAAPGGKPPTFFAGQLACIILPPWGRVQSRSAPAEKRRLGAVVGCKGRPFRARGRLFFHFARRFAGLFFHSSQASLSKKRRPAASFDYRLATALWQAGQIYLLPNARRFSVSGQKAQVKRCRFMITSCAATSAQISMGVFSPQPMAFLTSAGRTTLPSSSSSLICSVLSMSISPVSTVYHGYSHYNEEKQAPYNKHGVKICLLHLSQCANL